MERAAEMEKPDFGAVTAPKEVISAQADPPLLIYVLIQVLINAQEF